MLKALAEGFKFKGCEEALVCGIFTTNKIFKITELFKDTFESERAETIAVNIETRGQNQQNITTNKKS